MYTGTSRQAMPRCEASANVTAGLKCAPEMGPNASISATRAAPVAIVFARRATATFPPASLSPMMPDPMTAANRKAVPRASATARRATALLGRGFTAGFESSDKSTHEFVFHLRRNRIHVDPFTCKELARVLDAVYAGR